MFKKIAKVVSEEMDCRLGFSVYTTDCYGVFQFNFWFPVVYYHNGDPTVHTDFIHELLLLSNCGYKIVCGINLD